MARPIGMRRPAPARRWRRSGRIPPASSKDTTHIADHRQGRQHLRRDAERRLDHRRGDPRRHRHRHERARRAVLARQDAREPAPPARAAALHADAEPRASRTARRDGASARRAATTRIRRSCRRSSASSSSGTTWYPNLHAALERPRVQTLHFYGSFWPHTAGFNKLNVEATIPDAVYDELQARGHDVSRLRAVRDVGLRDGSDDRSGDGQPPRRRRSATRLLRDGVLTVPISEPSAPLPS